MRARYTRALARSMANTKQVKAANVLNNAQVTTANWWRRCIINLTLTHLATGGTFSNVLAVAADLNETSLEQSLIDIAGFVDERGLKIASQVEK